MFFLGFAVGLIAVSLIWVFAILPYLLNIGWPV